MLRTANWVRFYFYRVQVFMLGFDFLIKACIHYFPFFHHNGFMATGTLGDPRCVFLKPTYLLKTYRGLNRDKKYPKIATTNHSL